MNPKEQAIVFRVTKEEDQNIVDSLLNFCQELGIHITLDTLRIINRHFKKIVNEIKKK